jgi:hypothetical protein
MHRTIFFSDQPGGKRNDKLIRSASTGKPEAGSNTTPANRKLVQFEVAAVDGLQNRRNLSSRTSMFALVLQIFWAKKTS